MTNITIFIKNSDYDTLIEKLMVIPCFIIREFIEMDYSEIKIECRQEDATAVEEIICSCVEAGA